MRYILFHHYFFFKFYPKHYIYFSFILHTQNHQKTLKTISSSLFQTVPIASLTYHPVPGPKKQITVNLLQKLQYFKLHPLFKQMEQSLQILELSSQTKEQILRGLIKIFNQSDIARFTVIMGQIPIKGPQNKPHFALKVDQHQESVTNRQKSSTIDRFYRTTQFLNLKKSVTIINKDYSRDSFDDEELPQSPKELGEKLYRKGEFSEAAGIFQELREGFPLQNDDEQYREEYKQILNRLGDCYFRLEQYDKAVTTYKQLIRQYNSDASEKDDRIKGKLYNNLGCCYGKLGYEKLSMNSYNEALKIYGRHASADTSSLLFNIGNVYYNCQMFDVCERYYEQAIIQKQAKDPLDRTLLFHAYSKLALAQKQQKKCKDALQNLNKALKLGMGDPLQLLKQCAHVKELQGKWQQALQFYQKMHLLQEKAKKSKAFIFESVANIYLKIGKMVQLKKYRLLALEEYRKDGNEGKVSELGNSWTCLKTN